MESEGWELVHNNTVAGSTKSYEKDGKVYFEHEFMSDSPSKIKARLADLVNGGNLKLDHSHNIKTYRKIEHTPTANGTMKKVTYCQEEGDELGDGESAPVSNSTQSDPSIFNKVGEGVMDKCDYLKNMVDTHWNSCLLDRKVLYMTLCFAVAALVGVGALVWKIFF